MRSVRLPADVELEDRLAFGLSGRKLALLGAGGICALGAEQLAAALLPLPLAVAAALPVALAAVALALGGRDGLRGEELALALLRHLLAPRTLVPAPEGLPARLRGDRGARLAPLEPPVARIHASGLVELADGSHCRLLHARGTSFALRSPEEQAAFVAAFAGFLNGLDAPVQIHVARERVSLDRHAGELEQLAASAGAALAEAARAHAAYLRSLSDGEVPLSRRRILLVLRAHERSAELAEPRLQRGERQACELLRAAGVTLTPLSGGETAALLAGELAAGAVAGSRLEGVVRARRLPASSAG